jgi:curli biogenesis system outer membrane secretion channel CsgG
LKTIINTNFAVIRASTTALATLALCASVQAQFGALTGQSNAGTTHSGSKVEKCSKVFGTVTVTEPRAGSSSLSGYGLDSPAALLRLMIQQSGCFDVVERGQGMGAIRQERALASSGELQQGSNIGQGQMQAADFVLTPYVLVEASNTGGIGGALFGRLLIPPQEV